MHTTYRININFFIFFVFASGVISVYSCTETLEIKGKVIDERTKSGIPLKSLIVQALLPDSSNKQEPAEIGQFLTDSSGCFSYTLRKIKGARNYNFCLVGDSDYLFTNNKMTLSYIENNAEYLVFALNKLADLTINITRRSKKPLYDTLRLSWESNGVYGGFLYPYKLNKYGRNNSSFGGDSDRDLIWIGGYVNSTVNTKVFADKRTELSWDLYRNGKRMEFTDTIICKRDISNIVSFTY